MNTLLGQRIREQRKEKGWTIEQFAERVDLSTNYVGDLERGVKMPLPGHAPHGGRAPHREGGRPAAQHDELAEKVRGPKAPARRREHLRAG